MKTREQMAAEIGITEAQLDAVEEIWNDLDPAKRAEILKAIPVLERIARENNMTVDDLCRGATRYLQ